MKTKRFSLFTASIAAGLALLSPALHAGLITWDAGGANTNWSTINNWSDNLDPIADDVTFNSTGALASGTTNTVSSSVSINSLTYGIESATLQHTTAIAAGQTLAVTGNFLLAGSTTATASTNVTITGSTGTLTVSGASFQVGQTAPTAASPLHTLDMSGLAILTANLTGAASTFRLGASSGSSINAPVTLRLANTSTITTNTLGVGDAAAGGATQTLKLGSVSNTINANLVNVGSRSGRGSGNISFDTTTGTLKLRAADGTSAVSEMNMVNNGFGHSGTHVATVDFAGHSVDAKIAALNMALRTNTNTSNNGGGNSTLSFDTGTLDVGTATMARNANSLSSATTSATINIGGGTASFAAINMANSTASATSNTNAILNLTGGTTTVTGNIVKIGGSGPTSATVKLDGGTLDMDNGNIGDATNAVTLTLASGTLRNVAQVNGGADLSKTSAGNLVLSGNNTFTGGMNMSGGEVKITGNGSFGIGTKNLNIQNGAYVNLDGTAGDISLSSGITMTTAGLALLNTVGDNTINGNITVITGNSTTTATSDGGSLNLAGTIASGTGGARNLELSGTSVGANTVSGEIANANGIPGGSLNLIKSGIGTWTLTNDANSFTGSVTVNEGELKITKSGALGTGVKTIILPASPTVGYLSLDGSAGAITVCSDMTMKTAGVALLNLAGDNVINSPISIIGGSVFTRVTSDGGSLNLAGGVSAETESEYRRLELTGTSTGANTISGQISDGNSRVDILKTGTGIWALTNAENNYTGGTSVSGGTLLINGDNSSAGGAVNVQSEATLGGEGIVGGATTILSGGKLAVGDDGVGIQTFASGLTVDSGGIFDWDLAGNTTSGRGTNFDGVDVTGTLSIESNSIFRVIQNAGLDFADAFWATNRQWTDIFSAGTLASAWNNAAVSVYDTSNVQQNVSTYGSFSITGDALSWTAVPEPSNALVALLGVAVLVRRRR